MTAMKLKTGILAITITMTAALCGHAVAQNADAIDNARSTAKSLQQANATPASKPAPGAPAPAVKPAVIPGSQASAPAAAPAAKPAPASAAASSAHNQLQKVNVMQGADGVQIEIVSNNPVTPKVSKLSSPARVLVELPETISAASQNHIPVSSGGVKDVRIGTNDKTPPTTSVVVDLEKAAAFEVTPESSGKFILTLHTGEAAATAAAPAAAKSAPVPAKAAAPAAKTQTVAKNTAAPAASPASAPAKTSAANTPAAKPAATAKAEAKATAVAAKPAAPSAQPAKAVEASQARAEDKKPEEVKDAKKDEKKPEDKKWAMNGKRDPFFSPVIQQNGSGCSTGKKCLEIGNINLRGVVKSDNGFIAVVTNNLNKAYFLRENDPVFNGYVVKITGDSVVFQETVQDKLGKPFTREIVKRIFTPAV
jgi:Tfp pilus assembly protein PilP